MAESICECAAFPQHAGKTLSLCPRLRFRTGAQGPFVYVVGSDSKAEARPIQIDFAEGNLSVIRSGLQADEQVVFDGQDKLQPGARVTAHLTNLTPASVSNGANPPAAGDTCGHRNSKRSRFGSWPRPTWIRASWRAPKDRSREPFPAIYHPPGGDFAVDGGCVAGRWCRLHPTARFSVAAGGLSDDSGPYILSRSKSGSVIVGRNHATWSGNSDKFPACTR